MKRAFILLILAGCATPSTPAAPAVPLEARKTSSDAYASFHYVAEIKDAKTSVRVELGWRAPDRAFLRYGSSYAIYYVGGTGHYYFKRGWTSFDAAAELARLRKEYAGVDVGGEPKLSFLLSQWEALLYGRGLKATLGLQRAPRLAWLAELERWTSEGELRRKDLLEIELRPDAFIERAKAGSVAEMKLQSIRIDVPLEDELFEPPPKEGLPELPATAREELARAFEDSYRRWALETDASKRTIETLVNADLERLYEPSKMVAILKESLDKSLETWKTENKDAKRELLAEKLKVDKGKTLGSVEIMEKDIQLNFERTLDRALRLMPSPPPPAALREIAERWRDATARAVRAKILEPFEKVFDDKLRE